MEADRPLELSEPPNTQSSTAQKRNAFTELLSSQNKQHKPDPRLSGRVPARKSKISSHALNELGTYIKNPESFPKDVVVYHNNHFVAIHDKYPKSSLHLLLLPRDPTKSRLHPFEAFEDPEFLAKVKEEAHKLQKLAAKELCRMYSKESVQEQGREAALSAVPPPDELPIGRDWEKEIQCGVHAVPSMNDLHIHVIAVDRHSDCMKHRKHYNSFATSFFVPLEDFPLAKDDPRRDPTREGYLKQDLICWRCGRKFGNHFANLKKHLKEEFEVWKKL